MSSDAPNKWCSSCARSLPRTPEFFGRRGERGFQAYCRECSRAASKRRAERKKAEDPEAYARERAATDKASYAKRRDKILAQKKEYTARPEVKERRQEYMREWFQQNRDRQREYNKTYRLIYYWRNRDRILAYLKEWRKRDPMTRRLVERAKVARREEHYLNQRTAWRQAHPEAVRAAGARRRARLQAAGGSHTAADLAALWESQGGCCGYCGVSLEGEGAPAKNIDHMIPISRGGGDGVENLIWSCQPCNNSKATLTAEEFLQMLDSVRHQ